MAAITVTDMRTGGRLARKLWLSRCRLERHRFGPLEWLWRTLTYGRPPPASGSDFVTRSNVMR